MIGTVPGAVLMAANLLLIRGEAALSVGVGAIVLAVSGAVVGAVLGGHPELPPRPMALGALLGAIPGVLTFVVFTQLSPIVLVVGGVWGGLTAGRSARGQLGGTGSAPKDDGPQSSST